MEKPKKKIAELRQRVFPWRTQTLELFEDRMEMTVDGVMDHYRIPFYLHLLKEDPDIVLYIRWRWIALFSFLMIAGLILALLGMRGLDFEVGLGLGFVGGLGLTGSLICSRRIHVYYYKTSMEGGRGSFVPQLYLFPSRPSANEVHRFEELFRIAHEKQLEKARMEHEEMIPYARELERFANLRKDEVVTEEEYALIKAKLLNLKDRRIGF